MTGSPLAPPPGAAEPEARVSYRTTILVVILLFVVGMGFAWQEGVFDDVLVNVGLNASDCYDNGGNTVCGREGQRFTQVHHR